MRARFALKMRHWAHKLSPVYGPRWEEGQFRRGPGLEGDQTVIEFDATGTWAGSCLRINGSNVHDVIRFKVDVGPNGYAYTTVEFEGAPLRFVSDLNAEREA